ncbi:homoserine kinase [Sphingomonas sp. LaA6.9]|uniref:homoserine kinase n=1 Tax=Sphingomonas sp. LaA6.9 TaxID=2919914 RepID=UPI001F5041D9|nr:homoserine kinase [Sphingomonas sp. LaA6.9]MCJ8155937.1 homoserine kinase [Sphingomonas sp. LaA6.9]
MAVYTQVSAEALGDFLARFDVGELVSAKGIAEGVENSNYLVDTTSGRFILTLYEKRVSADDLPYFMALLDHLAARDMPVPCSVRDRSGEAIHVLEGRPACLIEFLPGVSVSHPTVTQAQAAGAAMGRMHAALADFPLTRANSMGLNTWYPLFERCGHALNEMAPDLYDDVGFTIEDLLSGWFHEELPQGTIHADLFPDNVLMRGDEVSGLIDFYFACTDIRAYDLAVMHSAWAFDASGRKFNPAIGDALIRGYEQTIPLSSHERAEFNALATGACVRFFLSRAWDWLNTPADALVTRKDPLAYWRRVKVYDPDLGHRFKSLA